MTKTQSIIKTQYYFFIGVFGLNIIFLAMDLYDFGTMQPMSFGGIIIPEPYGVLVLAVDLVLLGWSWYVIKRSRKILKKLEWHR